MSFSEDPAGPSVAMPPPPAGEVVEYYHLDALGSVRVVTDETGAILRHHDYLPFGEEWQPEIGSPDKRLFTGKERDVETGLDYFGARYYRADLGRFTTIDPALSSGPEADPQRWNAYVYGSNNPLNNIDPDGRRWFAKGGNAIWVEPNEDGTYTSPGEGWVEVGPTSEYNGRLNVAWVNGVLSYIGENDKGGKILTPFFQEEPIQDTTFSLAANLWLAGSLARAGVAAISARESGIALTEHGAARAALRGISEGDVKLAIETAKKTGQVITKIGKYGTPQKVYTGTNGVTVVVEQAGRNAGKVVTVYRPGS